MFNQFTAGSFQLHTPPTSLVEKLEVGTYTVNMHPMLGYYLSRTDDFTVPKKVYGQANGYPELIIERAFTDRKGKVTTAVLSGIKGSGKTLTAKKASLLGLAAGIPTLIVNNPFCGDGFTEFLQDLNKRLGPFILVIDEFEKIYTEQEQLNALLTLLDGTATLEMLVLLTMNSTLDEARFEFFKNRPGRTYFNIYFPPCTDEVIREYCADHLDDVSKTEMILAFTRRFTGFTLDLLTTLVFEYNRSKDKDLLALTEIFNIKPDVGVSNDAYIFKVMRVSDSRDLSRRVRDDYNIACNLLRYNSHTIIWEVQPSDPEFERLQSKWEQLNESAHVNVYPYRYRDVDDSWDVPSALRKDWEANHETAPDTVMYYRVSLTAHVEEESAFDVKVDYENRQLMLTAKDFDFRILLTAATPRPAKRLLLL